MSVLIASGVNGILSIPNVLDGTAKPITFCFFAKVDTLPTSSTSNVMVLKTSGGSGHLTARILQNGSIRSMNASSNDGSYNSAAYDLAGNLAGSWRGCVAVFTSNSNRAVFTRTNSDVGGLLTAVSANGNNTSGETGLELLSGVWGTSAARYSHITVYDQALTSNQADEFLLSGTIVGVTPLHRWGLTSDWGAGTIANTGSNTTAITPPNTWTYSADSPNFNTGPNTAPVVSNVKLYDFQYQISASDADGNALTYSITTQGSYGTASVNSAGLVTYTAGAEFVGIDTFTIGISDGIDMTYGTININAEILSINLSGIYRQSESPYYDGEYYNIDRP